MRQARRFDCQPESVAGARHFVRDVLSQEPREIVEAAELMTSELATNCVRHAHSDFELAIHRSREEIRVEVSDRGPGQPVMRSPTPREQSGRGLRIVQELAEDWGITPSPNGKLVWFSLPLRTQTGEPLRTHAGEHGSRSTASREQAPEQGHQPDRNHEPKQSHEADLGSHGAASSYVDLVEEHGKRGPFVAHSRIAKLWRSRVSPVLKFKRACAMVVIPFC
jgi:anti-sigma regulatory factor (Ser/Thr protein kinase)